MVSKRHVGIVAASLVFVGLCASTVYAVPRGEPGEPRADVPTEIILDSTGPGRGVSGSIGPVGSSSNPAVAYPPSTAGFTPLNEPFAGIIFTSPPGPGGPTLQMYCIDIRTPTNVGYGYDLGTWGEVNVTNVGHVALLLGQYYPNMPQPAIGSPGIANTADQAAAVQAAIWYFSDNYVLAPGDPLLPAVTTIVNAVRVQPPAPAPTPPSLQIVPPATTTGTVGSFIGPYTVDTGGAGNATVSANAGTTMYSDAAGTTPITNGASVASGTQIWLSRTEVGTATLTAQATATVPSGNVYIYNGNIVNVTDAQNLILAQTQTLDANANGNAEFQQQPTTTTSTTTTTTTMPTTTTSSTTTTSTSTTTTSTTTTTTEPTTTTTTPTTTTTEATTTTTEPTTSTTTEPTTSSSSTTPTTTPESTTSTSLSPDSSTSTTTTTTVPASSSSTTTTTPGALPVTGTDNADLAVFAILAIVGGSSMILVSRRPRRSE